MLVAACLALAASTMAQRTAVRRSIWRCCVFTTKGMARDAIYFPPPALVQDADQSEAELGDEVSRG